MSKLKLYVVRDSLAGSNELILTAKNDELLKRNIKGILLSRQQNFINTDTADKDVYEVAELETDNGIVTGLAVPSFVVNIEQLRLDLIAEIRRKKAEAGIEDQDDGQKEE